MMAKTLHLRYFAALREAAGLRAETYTGTAPDAAALYGELAARHGFTLALCEISVAVNDAYRPLSHPLQDGDDVVFIPPVAGG